MDEIQAAFLLVKLKFLDQENRMRQEIAGFYSRTINHPMIKLPTHPDNTMEQVWHLYVIQTDLRNELHDFLLENGIQTLIHYPIAPHKQLAYKGVFTHPLPITEKIHDKVLSLPISPVLTEQEIKYIAKTINRFH